MTPEPKLDRFRNRMKHWRLDGAVYFLTWRLQHTQTKLAEDERSVVAKAIKHFSG